MRVLALPRSSPQFDPSTASSTSGISRRDRWVWSQELTLSSAGCDPEPETETRQRRKKQEKHFKISFPFLFKPTPCSRKRQEASCPPPQYRPYFHCFGPQHKALWVWQYTVFWCRGSGGLTGWPVHRLLICKMAACLWSSDTCLVFAWK